MSCRILISNMKTDMGVYGSPVCVLPNSAPLGRSESAEVFNSETGRHGDFAAKFIVIEITDKSVGDMQWVTEHGDVYRYSIDIDALIKNKDIDVLKNNVVDMTLAEFEPLLMERIGNATGINSRS